MPCRCDVSNPSFMLRPLGWTARLLSWMGTWSETRRRRRSLHQLPPCLLDDVLGDTSDHHRLRRRMRYEQCWTYGDRRD